MDPMEMREKVLTQQEHVSSRISDLCRYIGFGLVAVVYAILTSDDSTAGQLFAVHHKWILAAAGFGALTILFDYVQFLSGYFSVQLALSNEDGGYKYDDTSVWWWLRHIMFWAKQVTALAGTLIFCWTMLVPLVAPPAP